jgi:hypothetical protein
MYNPASLADLICDLTDLLTCLQILKAKLQIMLAVGLHYQ